MHGCMCAHNTNCPKITGDIHSLKEHYTIYQHILFAHMYNRCMEDSTPILTLVKLHLHIPIFQPFFWPSWRLASILNHPDWKNYYYHHSYYKTTYHSSTHKIPKWNPYLFFSSSNCGKGSYTITTKFTFPAITMLYKHQTFNLELKLFREGERDEFIATYHVRRFSK